MEAYKQVRDTVFFQAFREEGFPSHYGENRISAALDTDGLILIAFFVIPALGFLIILPGFRGKEQFFVLLRTVFSLGIGFLIIWCNLEYLWRTARVTIYTQYKVGSPKRIEANLGLRMGLRGFNVTFIEVPYIDADSSDRLYYNEHFSWEWNQGRPGFGPQAGKLQNEYRDAQKRGLPLPILKVAEYFTVDGDGLRIGRHYRTAGWYTHICLWFAFGLWILSNILFTMIIQYGAVMLFLTGKLLILSCILYCNIQSSLTLEIPFEASDGVNLTWLQPSYSWCYYLNMANGFVCILLSLIAVYADLRYPDETAQFFGIDVLQAYEDVYTEVQENPSNDQHADGMNTSASTTYVALRKRGPLSARLSRLQRMTMKGVPNAGPRGKTESHAEMPQYAVSMNVKKNNDEVIVDVPILRKKIHPDAPVYENFIRESKVITEETET